MSTGTIAKWLKAEGDEIAPGDVIAEVETDKASVGYEAQEEGYLAKILVPEGAADLEIGAPLAILVRLPRCAPRGPPEGRRTLFAHPLSRLGPGGGQGGR